MKNAVCICLLSLSLSLFSNRVFAQAYSGSPCTSGNDRLRALINKEVVKELFIDECSPNRGPIATSLLKASGRAPVSIHDPAFTPPADWSEEDGDERYDTWTCMYAAGKIVDGDTGTAWVEGVPGNGSGEAILIPARTMSRELLDVFKGVEIYAGFGKSDALYRANSRPRTVNLHVLRARKKGTAQCGVSYEQIARIASRQMVLRDVNGFQPLVLPDVAKETVTRNGAAVEYDYWLMIEIVDVYPGSKYQDTCISEIRNR